jgi:1-deoxy-D-xylulose-5-phosphate reductoisomerase
VRKIIITASGGPFYNRKDLSNITPEEALNHPTWEMGNKVTIDSATLMNKGLEIIEASIISQMSIPDMRLPIQYALTSPDRYPLVKNNLNFQKINSLNFKEIDREKFPLIDLSYKALQEGGTLPAVLVGADEIAVDRFLKGEIAFRDIMKIIIKVTNLHKNNKKPGEEEIIEALNWARQEARRIM